MARTKVKGIKFGTFAQYQAITPKDPDTLYFITDRGGTIYRGTSLVIPQKVIENVPQTSVNSIGGVSVSGTNVAKRTFTITAFSSNGSNPTTITFDVYTKEAVDAVIGVLKTVMDTHRDCGGGNYADGKATGKIFGHVMLSDTINENTPQEIQDGVAATPKAVYDYVQSQIGGIGGGVIFNGTIGAAAAYDTSASYKNGDYCEHRDNLYRCIAEAGTIVSGTWNAENWTEIQRTVSSLPTPADGYEAGWEYVVVAPGTYAGKVCEVNDRIMSLNNSQGSSSTVVNDDWTVVQGNIDGAVTAANDLNNNTLVLGNGSKTVKKLSNGTAGQWLRIVDGRPQWADHPNTDHGIAAGTCQTETSTSDKVVNLFSSSPGTFRLVAGAIVAVYFPYEAYGDITMNVDGTGAVEVTYHDEALPQGLIESDNTALFMYDGVYWLCITVDKRLKPVATSGDYNDLIHKPIFYVKNNQNANELNRVIQVSDYNETNNSGVKILAVTFTNGIIYDSQSNMPRLSVNSGQSLQLLWNGGLLVSGMIQPGDTAIIVKGANSYDILAVNRQINNRIFSTTNSSSYNLVTDKAVFDYVNQQIDANALWWEELQSTNN